MRPVMIVTGGSQGIGAAVAREQLEAQGIEVHDVGLCTICDERFFSHRRDHGVTGRQSGVICRA